MNSIEVIMDNLEARGFMPYFVENLDEAEQLLLDIIPLEAEVGTGGSVTLDTMDIRRKLFDRGNGVLYGKTYTLATDRVHELSTQDLTWFLSSANALTIEGEIVNTDGSCNRIANTVWGAENIAFIIGINKVVENLQEAFNRIKNIATPLNVKRLNARRSPDNQITDEEIARATLILHHPSRGKNVYVILVNESVGY